MRKAKGIDPKNSRKFVARNSGKSTMELEKIMNSEGVKMQVQDKNLKFRVNVKFTLGDTQHEVEETEASWYLVDQQGNFYYHSPMQPIRPCVKEDSLEFKLKIGEEYLTIEEIEKRLNTNCIGGHN